MSNLKVEALHGTWTIDPKPIVPPSEQVENSSLYFEKANSTWFLFTNHIGIDDGGEYTEAIWVYWTKNLNHWDPARDAIVLDGKYSRWSKRCIGLPSVAVKVVLGFWQAVGTAVDRHVLGIAVGHSKRRLGCGGQIDLQIVRD